jgi:pyruvate carboxylase
MGSSFEQAVKGGFLDRMSDILTKELPLVHRELGNFWSVTPGSQILWTTAVTHTLSGKRYENASEDLKRLMLERYGPFPFHRPSDDIYRAVFGPEWKKTLSNECGAETCSPIDIEEERRHLEEALGRPSDMDELVLYLQHPRDAVDYFKFEEDYGKAYVLPPEVWFRQGGFSPGEEVVFRDYTGKHHQIVFGPSSEIEDGGVRTYLLVDHHLEPFAHRPEGESEKTKEQEMTREELTMLAEMGEIRAMTTGFITEVHVRENDRVKEGDLMVVLEAMKMLNSISSALDGVVKEVAVKAGQEVKQGDLMVRIRPKKAGD